MANKTSNRAADWYEHSESRRLYNGGDRNLTGSVKRFRFR